MQRVVLSNSVTAHSSALLQERVRVHNLDAHETVQALLLWSAKTSLGQKYLSASIGYVMG
jgi:hypothetical protein